MMIKGQKQQSPLISNDEIAHQLERLLASPHFNATPQQIVILKYVVNQTLSGNTGRIKGYTVATEALGRKPDFDSSYDPIVSIQANRLRQALELYYETSGKHDPIRIDIPKGAYVPSFEKRPYAFSSDIAINGEYPDNKAGSGWPSVLVRPLRNLSGDPELDFWGIGMATELANELNRYPDIRVITLGADNSNKDIDQRTAQFVIDGSSRSDGTALKVILNLTDTRTGHQIWSESGRSSIEAASLTAFQEDLARSIAVKIAGERGWIMKTLDKAFKQNPPQHATVYEAILRNTEYETTFTSEAFSRALVALEKAVIIEPEYGPAWSLLARLYANIYAFDIPGPADPLEKAFEYAQKGTRLSPDSKRCRASLAYIHLFRNDLSAGLAEAERALKLGPDTLFMLDRIGYLMTLMGDFERGPALIRKVTQLNPFYSNYVHFSLWVSCLRHTDSAQAHREAMKHKSPALFWNHIVMAASHGLTGNIKDGRRSAAELHKLKPDFPANGRILIRNFIKFEDIIEQTLEGLNAVGVRVK